MKSIITALLAAALAAAGTAMACDGLGENTHMGNIISIDRSDHTFVIVDTESRARISFSATQQMLAPLSVDDLVQVRYEAGTGNYLRSVDLIRL